jgi:hypothetical protein
MFPTTRSCTFLAVFAALLLQPAALSAAPQQEDRGAEAVCFSNADCDPDEFCAADQVGRCDDPGECAQIPDICFLSIDLVCGCDGQTYSNSCFAAEAGVRVAAEGACDAQVCTGDGDCADGFFCLKDQGDCNGTGNCQLVSEVCRLIFHRVCGCDGQTYFNSCFAAAARVNVAKDGPCQ